VPRHRTLLRTLETESTSARWPWKGTWTYRQPR
jgi:hypothetical protein